MGPGTVRWATVCFGLLIACWSVLTPLAEAPDEPAHLGLVLEVADTGRYPAYDGLRHSQGIVQVCRDYAVSTQWCRTTQERAGDVEVRERRAEDAPDRGARAEAGDAPFDRPAGDRMNQMPQHPPLYYQLMAGALRVERAVLPGDMSVDTELAFLRLLNVVLLLPLPWLAWLTARRLGLGETVATVAALAPLAVPQLTHIGGTFNNDNLFAVLVAALVALLAGVVGGGDRSGRTVVLVGVVTGLALLTKGFGVVLPALVVLAYWLGVGACGWRTRLRGAAPGALVALGVAFVVSGWWYVGNLVRTGDVVPSIEDEGRLNPANRPDSFQPDVGEWLASTSARMVEGFWGSFGWRTVRLPFAVSLAATVVVALAVTIAAIAPLQPRRSGPSRVAQSATRLGTERRVAVFLGAPVVLLGVFVVLRSADVYWGTGTMAFQQGRYLFGGLTALAVLAAAGAVRGLGERAVPVVVGVAVGLQGLALGWCLAGWWDADQVGPLAAVRAAVAWSGWPPAVALAALAGGVVALVALPVGTWRAWPATALSAPDGADEAERLSGSQPVTTHSLQR